MNYLLNMRYLGNHSPALRMLKECHCVSYPRHSEETYRTVHGYDICEGNIHAWLGYPAGWENSAVIPFGQLRIMLVLRQTQDIQIPVAVAVDAMESQRSFETGK
jgi:hypothetical protein